MVAINSDIEWAAASRLQVPAVRDHGFAGWRYNGSGRRRDRAMPLVSRFRSSQTSAAPSDANFGIKGTLQLYASSAPFEPEVRSRPWSTTCANFGFGALVAVEIAPATLQGTLSAFPPAAPMPVVPPSFTPNFAALAGDYDVVLCDVWGVVHNGVAAAAEACDALARFRARGGTVVLITNAPRPGERVARLTLDRLGVPRAAYDGIVSSGDVTRALIAA